MTSSRIRGPTTAAGDASAHSQVRLVVFNGWQAQQNVRRLLAQLADPEQIAASSTAEARALAQGKDGALPVRVYDVRDLLPPVTQAEPTTAPAVVYSFAGAVV